MNPTNQKLILIPIYITLIPKVNNFLIQNYILFIFTFFFILSFFSFVHRSSMWNIESRPYNEITTWWSWRSLHNILYCVTVTVTHFIHKIFTQKKTRLIWYSLACCIARQQDTVVILLLQKKAHTFTLLLFSHLLLFLMLIVIPKGRETSQ